ncbi:M23 family metallopeptidase [Sphingomonas ginkgonis]|uniref:M23 family metallopeptidase n=1 Tax=Sphingomonas ginkgonis TaxID=2315330 RepID=A0A429VAS5_9SPHN|nr:M23 family metallopeptidase [Sphingomonas ginkgonis]RST30942.1 M23 family metallopeptidase [Sphingomonas ginkgonis]
MTGRGFSIASTLIVVAVLLGAVWLFIFNIQHAPSGLSPGRAPGRTDATPASTAPEQPRNVEVGPFGLAVPVAGVRTGELVDTFDAARSGGRVHDAIDIMAPEGTPVVAAADGQVEKLFNSFRGGITLYVRSPDTRWNYYYAHLNRYAPGIGEGQQVRRGQLLGFVGHTGDASPSGPHLHFAINQMGRGDGWWEGQAINPYPLLAGRPGSR